MNNSNKFLKIAVALLLITNIALVAFILLGKNGKVKKDSRPDITEMLAKEVGLTEEQKTTHRQMHAEHRKMMKPLMDSIREAKISYYKNIKEASNDSLINLYSSQISALQISIDKTMLTHLLKVRAFLQPAQQAKFDTVVIKMMSRSRRDSAAK